MTINAATYTVEQRLTVHLPGYEPITDMVKKSEWNGLWELRRPGTNGCLIFMPDESFFSGLIGSVFGTQEPRTARVVAVSPGLLVPIISTELP